MASIGEDEVTGLVWLDDAEVNAAWYEALAAIDLHRDKKPLVRLLKSGQVPPRSIAFYIGDLLDRYTLKHPKARPRVPAYLRTPEQFKLMAAELEVRLRVRFDRVKAAVALEQVAAETGLSQETLTAAYLGQHGGLRRVAQRRYRP
jgi:hypothetical protein